MTAQATAQEWCALARTLAMRWHICKSSTRAESDESLRSGLREVHVNALRDSNRFIPEISLFEV